MKKILDNFNVRRKPLSEMIFDRYNPLIHVNDNWKEILRKYHGEYCKPQIKIITGYTELLKLKNQFTVIDIFQNGSKSIFQIDPLEVASVIVTNVSADRYIMFSYHPSTEEAIEFSVFDEFREHISAMPDYYILFQNCKLVNLDALNEGQDIIGISRKKWMDIWSNDRNEHHLLIRYKQ